MLILHTKKAQISLEFVIMISLTLIIFTGFYAALMHKQTAALNYNLDLQAKMLTNQLVYEIDLALTQGDNFTKKFELPWKISGQNYTITTEVSENGTFIYLEYIERFSQGYTSANLTGSLFPGNNTIKKIGGVVYAN